MNIIILVLVTALSLGVLICGLVLIYLKVVAEKEYRGYLALDKIPTSVSVHTYKPVGEIIPHRGWLVLERGVSLASHVKRPLILSVGFTTPSELTESEIYRDGALANLPLARDVYFLTAEDHAVRETYGEVVQTIKKIRNLGSSVHVAYGLKPHIARIKLLWEKAGYEGIDVYFAPVPGPFKYWFWEMAMLILHFIAPPESKLQNLLLDLGGRKA